MSRNKFENLVTASKFAGKGAKGNPRDKYLDVLFTWHSRGKNIDIIRNWRSCEMTNYGRRRLSARHIMMIVMREAGRQDGMQTGRLINRESVGQTDRIN